MRLAGLGLVVLLLASGCSGTSSPSNRTIDPVIRECGGAAQSRGPDLSPLPAWQGSNEDIARAFASAIGRELGPYGAAPGELSDQSKMMWKVGEGYLAVWDAPGVVYDKQIVLNDADWPGANADDARAHVKAVLTKMGAGADQVTVGDFQYRRLEWTQPTPAGSMAAGRSERTSQWTRSSFSRHFDFPAIATIEPQEAVDLAATFDACRTPHNHEATATTPTVSVADGRLAFLVVLAYGPGTPGGLTYHGCPPPRTWVSVDAVTGAILAWDDTYLCD